MAYSHSSSFIDYNLHFRVKENLGSMEIQFLYIVQAFGYIQFEFMVILRGFFFIRIESEEIAESE